MTQVDMKIEAKSDQLNADDLISGPRTITISGVRGVDGDQPVAVSYEGDGGKPFKPCKTVRRVMVHCWGDVAKEYVGKRMTLYRDPEVAFGGMKVGGIRVSHMSHIDHEMVIPLMVTKGKRKPYSVSPLRAEVRSGPPAGRAASPPPPPAAGDDFPGDRGQQTQASTSQLPLSQRADAYEERVKGAPSTIKLNAIKRAAEQLLADLDAADPERRVELDQLWQTQLDLKAGEERQGV